MPREDHTRIKDMIVAAEEVVRFVAGRQREDLDTDVMLQFACVPGIEIIGEAAANISAEVRIAYPAVPSQDIVGMRHCIVHAYFEIDLDIVWKTATEELKLLLPILCEIEADQ